MNIQEQYPTIFSRTYLSKIDHSPKSGLPHLYPHILANDGTEDDVVDEFMRYLKEQNGKPILIDIKPDSISIDGEKSKRHFVNEVLRGDIKLDPSVERWDLHQSILSQYSPALSERFGSKCMELPVVIKWDLASLNFLRRDSFAFIVDFIRGMRKANIVSVFYGVTGNEKLLTQIEHISVPLKKTKGLPYTYFSKGNADEVIELVMDLLPKTINNYGADYYKQMAYASVSVFVNAIDFVKQKYTLEDIIAAFTYQSFIDELLNALPKDSKKRKDLEVLVLKYEIGVSGIVDFEKLRSDVGGLVGRMALCLKKEA